MSSTLICMLPIGSYFCLTHDGASSRELGRREGSYLAFSALAFITSLLIELNDKEERENAVVAPALVDPVPLFPGGAKRRRRWGVEWERRRAAFSSLIFRQISPPTRDTHGTTLSLSLSV